MNDEQKIEWIFCAADKMVKTLGFCNFRNVIQIRENLQALNQNDSQMEAMKNEDLFECPLCGTAWFKKHLEKKHRWKFCSVENADTDSNPVHCFLCICLYC